MRIILLVLTCAISGVCQDLPVRTPNAYESLFLTVSQLAGLPSDKLAEPTIQNAIGLTNEEMQRLVDTAAECTEKTRALGQQFGRLVFEGRLRAIESGDSVWLVQRKKEIDDRVELIVSKSIDDLKRSLGEAGFQKVEQFVRSDWPHRCFIAPCAAPVARRR